MIPAKADVEQQRDFLEKQLLPRLQEAKEGKRDVWFVDASHFLYGPVLGCLWCLARMFVKAPAGRKRHNVLGAVNAITRQVVWIGTTARITQHTVVRLIKMIGRDADLGHEKPITWVLDNAKYNHTWLVRLAAAWFGIELLYLPTYSPNLNLIERLWKFVKKEALANRWHENFTDFQTAIESCLASTSTDHKETLETLLTLNFQTFDDVPVLAA